MKAVIYMYIYLSKNTVETNTKIVHLLFIFLITGFLWLQLFLFLTSRFANSIAFSNMYVYTVEMFLIELGMLSCGITSMFGQLGSMLSLQMFLLICIRNRIIENNKFWL